MKEYICLCAHLLLFLPMATSYSADQTNGTSGKTKLQVISNPDDHLSSDKYIRVIRRKSDGAIDESFNEVQCFAQDGEFRGKCWPVALSDGKFLLADCFLHDNGQAKDCRFIRFRENGTIDTSFQVPFSSVFNELVNGNPLHRIKNIEEVSVVSPTRISIKGEFISPLVGWDKKQAGALDGEGDLPGRQGIVLLDNNGKFLSFSPSAKQWPALQRLGSPPK